MDPIAHGFVLVESRARSLSNGARPGTIIRHEVDSQATRGPLITWTIPPLQSRAPHTREGIEEVKYVAFSLRKKRVCPREDRHLTIKL
ncbi:hypothetical protein NL676_024512 [Syzygium grande]|nr:hypothetical protein NL676_024512 [Syzygium grande]